MRDAAVLVAVLVISCPFLLLVLIKPTRYNARQSKSISCSVSVQVLVLGDIGRSPRMQYHALSIAKHGGRVLLTGYTESPLQQQLLDHPMVTIVPLSPPPRFLQTFGLPFVLAGPLKVLFQIYTLLSALLYEHHATRFLLVQNPPSVPVLALAYLASILRNTELVVDWHNYGYTILAAKLPEKHPLVRISKVYEQTLGRWAPTVNFTVTDAMAKQLKMQPWMIKSPIITLHDRPASIFQPLPEGEAGVARRSKFLMQLPETKDFYMHIMDGSVRLLISSTSWTADEDFGLLLEALVAYAAQSADAKSAPILAIITGKGPEKAAYLARIERLTRAGKLEGVTIRTAWLSMEDYAQLLACADLGVCLHTSSSGVDLPMKVVDMFGAGLPVVGYARYESWSELVHERVNGRGFETATELTAILAELFDSRSGLKMLSELRRGAVKEGSRRWDEEWDDVAKGVFGL